MSTDPRYPIGPFADSGDRSAYRRTRLIDRLAELPKALRNAVKDLTAPQLDTPYREGGWTVRQVVHHLADSHMHAYARFKFAVTEDQPAVKGYAEQDWANLTDACSMPLEPSLLILEGVHARWCRFLRHLPAEAFDRAYIHSERGPESLAVALELYDWHGLHHLQHILNAPR